TTKTTNKQKQIHQLHSDLSGRINLKSLYFSGAIFTQEQKDSSTELAFKYAVYRINKDKNILPNTTLMYDIQYVPKDDSFRTSKKGQLCSSSYFVIRDIGLFFGG
ncbi:hypothetical protein AAG570_006681, partial [Ranatra chinensis]